MYWPLLQQGSNGENVRTVQYLLNAQDVPTTVDGVFGTITANAVSAFQSSIGLLADGIVGDATWPALLMQVSSGDTGDAVRAVQSQLNSRSNQITVDGVFGAETTRAVQLFQGPVGIVVDAVVNWYTWHAILRGYLLGRDAAACMQSVFQAWTDNSQMSASRNATPDVLSALFGHPHNPAAGWTFDTCLGAAGHVYCTWNRPGGSLVIGGPDPGGGLYVYADRATFQP